MTISDSTPTVFDIEFVDSQAPGVNPYSARGLRGSFSPIDLAKGLDKLARTLNGTLVDLSMPQMRKYKLTVNGSDVAPPALSGLWVGMPVLVNSFVEVAFWSGDGVGAPPDRPVVPGSPRYEGIYTYYCPQMTMMVVDWQIDRDEWQEGVTWSLSLEEV